MEKEEKPFENLDEHQYLFVLLEQSWAYIRHAQTMFWQSFTALLTVIAAIIFFSYDKPMLIRGIGFIFSAILAIVGYFVVSRIFTVLREHFITINRIRRHCDIDNIPDVILMRWKRYELNDFKLFRSETRYIFVVHQSYIAIFSSLFGYLLSLLITYFGFITTPQFYTVLLFAIPPLIVLERDAIKKVYYANTDLKDK